MEKLIKQFLKIDSDGDGYGHGDGDGNGYGDGNGNGKANGDGVIFHSFRNKNVYYIDKIPCIFDSIKGNAALVSVINVADFSDSKMYIVKRGSLFAHGNTLKE